MKAFLIVAAAAAAFSAPVMSKPMGGGQGGGNPDTPPTCTLGDVTAEGAAADDCRVYEGNDKIPDGPGQEYTVNEVNLFGFDDWELLGKDESGSANDIGDVGLIVTGMGDKSGTWSLDTGVLSAYSEYAIVLKSANYWAGYLFEDLADSLADSGTWSTALFTNKDLSHFTIYARGEGGGGGIPVPEPAALGLLGLGLAGIALGRRRRS